MARKKRGGKRGRNGTPVPEAVPAKPAEPTVSSRHRDAGNKLYNEHKSFTAATLKASRLLAAVDEYEKAFSTADASESAKASRNLAVAHAAMYDVPAAYVHCRSGFSALGQAVAFGMQALSRGDTSRAVERISG